MKKRVKKKKKEKPSKRNIEKYSIPTSRQGRPPPVPPPGSGILTGFPFDPALGACPKKIFYDFFYFIRQSFPGRSNQEKRGKGEEKEG
jgi:hypothetical protein